MLKRETFVNAICALRKQEKLTEQMNHIYRQMTNGIGHFEMDGLAQNALLQTLEDAMEDEYCGGCMRHRMMIKACPGRITAALSPLILMM